MAGPLVTTVKGRLQLVIGDGEPVELGGIEIPVEVDTKGVNAAGSLVLHTRPNLREVREFFEQVFGAELEHRAEAAKAEKGTE